MKAMDNCSSYRAVLPAIDQVKECVECGGDAPAVLLSLAGACPDCVEHARKDNYDAECPYCGEPCLLDELDLSGRCPSCAAKKAEEDGDVEHICSNCNGSGEGMYEGTRCWACKGEGVQREP